METAKDTRPALRYAQSRSRLFFTMGGRAHAELTVLAMAGRRGHPDIEVLVPVGDQGRGVIGACGLCRQMLLDHAL